MTSRNVIYLLIVLSILTVSSVAQSDTVTEGLECYLDFTKPPDFGRIYVDITGKGNNAMLQNGAYFDPRGGHWGDSVKLNGGWIDIDPTGSLNTLAVGTCELIFSSMSTRSYGVPFAWADVMPSGYESGFETWADRRTQPTGS